MGDAGSVLALWNSFLQLLRADAITPDRARQFRKRLADPYWRENWRAAIKRLAESDFAKGGGPNGWRATFDWFLKAGSLVKVLEGQYDNRTAPAQVKAEIAQFEAELEGESNPEKRKALRLRIRTLEAPRENRPQAGNKCSPWHLKTQIEALESVITNHPANRNNMAYDEVCTIAERQDLTRKRHELGELTLRLAEGEAGGDG